MRPELQGSKRLSSCEKQIMEYLLLLRRSALDMKGISFWEKMVG